jgi:hypothetical protein
MEHAFHVGLVLPELGTQLFQLFLTVPFGPQGFAEQNRHSFLQYWYPLQYALHQLLNPSRI